MNVRFWPTLCICTALCIQKVGQNYIYTVYIRYFFRDVIKFTVINGEYIQFWPTLCTRGLFCKP